MSQIRISCADWEMNEYRVTGINPKTKRRKSVVVVVMGEDAEKAKQKSGLLNITDVERVEQEPPSQAQIEYGNDLGIDYKSYYTKRDYSCLISYATDEEIYYPIEKEAAELAESRGIYLSQYASLTQLYYLYFHDLSVKEACAFYAFSLYQSLNGFECYDYHKHSKYELFEQFADENVDNGSFTHSLLPTGSNQYIPKHCEVLQTTNAFKICYNWLNKKAVVPQLEKGDVSIGNPPSRPAQRQTKPDAASTEKGTFSIICDKCGAENPNSRKYCINCQSRLIPNVVCPKCKVQNNHNNDYCTNCHYCFNPEAEAKAEEAAKEAANKDKKSSLVTGIVICILAVVFIAILFFSCNSSNSTDRDSSKSESSISYSSQSTTVSPTGNGGITANFVETFLQNRIPDAKKVSCAIYSNGDYWVDFTLSDEKSEWETNYDEFALSVKKACDDFEKTYSVKANIFSIIYFFEESSRIYWLSMDGGETGILYEKHGNFYKNETAMSFNELVNHYAVKH